MRNSNSNSNSKSVLTSGDVVAFRSLLTVDTRPNWSAPVKAAAQQPETVIALRSVANTGSK